MEIVAVSSAVYGLVLSMVICVVAVAIFTGHLGLLTITVVTMLGNACFGLVDCTIYLANDFTSKSSYNYIIRITASLSS